jgi:hypothetical protein
MPNLPEYYNRIILWVSNSTGLSDALLHVHAGLFILILSRLTIRQSYGTFFPFAFVALAETANELLDYMAYGWRPMDTYQDIANTLFWPFLISLVARLQPLLIPDKR